MIEAASTAASPMHRLITICFSHYVERARWGLDLAALDYSEEPHMPVFHSPFVWAEHRGRAGRRDAASSPLSTPVLVPPEGEPICDSRAILAYLDQPAQLRGREPLYPAEHPEAARLDALEQRWHDKLATHSRRLAYGACFSSPGVLREIAERNVGGTEARVFRAAVPLIERFMIRYLRIDDASIERSRERCWHELDAAAEALDDGRPYLAGERFSGWDLSFACFAAPLLLPPEYGAWIPGPSELDEDTRAYVAQVRAHPAGRHALRMFAEHRPPSGLRQARA